MWLFCVLANIVEKTMKLSQTRVEDFFIEVAMKKNSVPTIKKNYYIFTIFLSTLKVFINYSVQTFIIIQ